MHTLPTTLTAAQFVAVYNALSFVIASMGASTAYFWLNAFWVAPAYKSAVAVSGLVTFIACYHYFRIFNSWDDAYEFKCNYGQYADKFGPGNNSIPDFMKNTKIGECVAIATGGMFNDAYRYMDWILTVPMLLLELVLVMRLPAGQATKVAWKLGAAAALMVVLGLPGEYSNGNGTRWLFWALAMIPFAYVVYMLFVGLGDAAKASAGASELIKWARIVTVVSWLTYPVVYMLPMCGLSRESSEVGIQIGYSFSDVISKCVVGFMVLNIAKIRSSSEEDVGLINP